MPGGPRLPRFTHSFWSISFDRGGRGESMKASSRRSFLGRCIPAAGLLELSLKSAAAGTDGAASAAVLATKAVGFLPSRQAADGSWSSDSKEPGITALVVAALLRSGRVTPDDPAIVKGLAYLERFLGPKG